MDHEIVITKKKNKPQQVMKSLNNEIKKKIRLKKKAIHIIELEHLS